MAEHDLLDQVEKVAAMRRALPPAPEIQNFPFLDVENEKPVWLTELFEPGKPELILYHLMYNAEDHEFCPMCSMWIDGVNAVAKHVEQRANLAVASDAPAGQIMAYAHQRGWNNIRLLADDSDYFAREIGAKDANGDSIETVAVFTKDDGTIRNTYLTHAYESGHARHMDLLSPVWQILDLLPSGRSNWQPN